MGDLHARIAAIQYQHRQELFAFLPQCACGFSLDSSHSGVAHRKHLTDMLIQDLQLIEDGGVIVGCVHD